MGHTACTDPQCPYKGAIYVLPLPFRCGVILPPQGNERNFRRTVSKYPGFEPLADPKQGVDRLRYDVIFATLLLKLHINKSWYCKRSVVKVLCYKSEGRWFDPSWCHWNFSLT